MSKTMVAWVSKQPPLPAQIDELNRELGEVEVVQLADDFTNADDVYDKVKGRGAKYAVVSLPVSIIAGLVEKGDVTWLRPVFWPAHWEDCPGAGKCKWFNEGRDVIVEVMGFVLHFTFVRFDRIVKVELVTEPFYPSQALRTCAQPA